MKKIASELLVQRLINRVDQGQRRSAIASTLVRNELDQLKGH